MIWQQLIELIKYVNIILAWATNAESEFDFQTYGENRRVPVDLDGLRLAFFIF